MTGDTMRAWRLHEASRVTRDGEPLELERVAIPVPGEDEVLVRVHACGVCHTELDEIEGRAPPPRLPVVPGHQVVGTVEAAGSACRLDLVGQRVGVAWIHSACGACGACRDGRENLCPDFRGCGKEVNGGYAEYLSAPEAFVHRIPDVLSDQAAAPLLCAGAVGFRALALCDLEGEEPLGLTGFGASGHLVLQMARLQRPEAPVFVFARNPEQRDLAMRLGASWAGDTGASPPKPPGAIIDTTPAWKPVLAALEVLRDGGRLVINAIAKEAGDLEAWQTLDYQRHLWREKQLRTVTNVTRRDVRDCLALAARGGLTPAVRVRPFGEANAAIRELRYGDVAGACVLSME